MELEREVFIEGVPKDIIFHAIEMINEALINDAKNKFRNYQNFSAKLIADKKVDRIASEINFSMYNYSFEWILSNEREGILVTLMSKTPGKWWESLFDMETKLNNLTDTMWSALYNFSIGFVTAVSYIKFKKKPAKAHVRGARKKITERSRKKRK